MCWGVVKHSFIHSSGTANFKFKLLTTKTTACVINGCFVIFRPGGLRVPEEAEADRPARAAVVVAPAGHGQQQRGRPHRGPAPLDSRPRQRAAQAHGIEPPRQGKRQRDHATSPDAAGLHRPKLTPHAPCSPCSSFDHTPDPGKLCGLFVSFLGLNVTTN